MTNQLHLSLNKAITGLVLTFLAFIVLLTSSINTFAQYSAVSTTPAFPEGSTSGQLDSINVEINSTRTVSNPVAGIESIVFTFNSPVTNGSIQYVIRPVSDFGPFPSGSGLYVVEFITENIDRSTVNLAIIYKISSAYTNVKSFIRSSPPVEVTSSRGSTDSQGYTSYSVSLQGVPQYFGVSGTGSTIRSGGESMSDIYTPITIGLVLLVILSASSLLFANPTSQRIQR